MVYEGDRLVLYELEDLQVGAKGNVRIIRDPENPLRAEIQFEYGGGNTGTQKRRTEAWVENTLINDMVGPFLAAHWDALSRGEKVKCRYIVVSRRETVGFTFVKEVDPSRRDQSEIVVRMEAGSALASVLVAPLFFTVEAAKPHRVVQYVGRTTPKLRIGGKWKDLDAVTIFDWQSAR